ncbi:aldo/keto reductase, partial [bacterium]
MKTRNIGDRSVGEIGLGCMGMSYAYGQPDDPSSLAVLARSLEIGVDHWDTADMYGAGENEKLLAKALPGVRDQVFLATKFGNVYDRSLTSHQDQVQANAGWIVDGTPEYARKSIDLSLGRLGVDHVDLYYLHRTDDLVPIEETVGAMAEFVKAGKVRALGLSECSAETLRRAHAVHPIAAVQSELSVWTRDYLPDVVPLCAELGIAFVAYSPLGRGFLTGAFNSPEDFPEGDYRQRSPRFQGENFAKNKAIVDAVKEIADARGAKPGQVALAWVLAQGDHVVTIPGTKR